MEKSTEKTTRKVITPDQLRAAYIDYMLVNGDKPPSIYAYAKHLKTTEAVFYEHFNSFKALERSIWEEWYLKTVKWVEKDPAYAEYTVREKLLAFYFTWLETLKSNRSFVLKHFESLDKTELNPYFLQGVKDHFKSYINDLLIEGKDTSEVADRPFSNQYEKAFWFHFIFILRFWINDDSEGFEKTDAAVEKSVHLAFDLVSKGPLDSMIDFGKFLFQNRP